ncbi:MAG: PH domain-containing protein [Anaerovibrio sp.]|uniref:PH domain-containing protein n=1 Tax=Anaerovibrio sp. TaxID=1872532 RepID=UPI0025F026CB|nr:PH domain-containing protein [Anaerovibrio sp.]MCR5176872.1 PH domain-containing protein [Anaerovibrio sp.]
MSSTVAARRLDTLGMTEPRSNLSMYEHVLLPEETVLMEFKAFRDVAVFTNKKIIAVNVQGLTGSKVEVLVLPYSKMTAYAVESAGGFDLDAELKLWSSGIGLVELEFVRGQVDVKALGTLMSKVVGVPENMQPDISGAVMSQGNVLNTGAQPAANQNPAPAAASNVQAPHVCKNCGAPVSEGHKFCIKCGTPVN